MAIEPKYIELNYIPIVQDVSSGSSYAGGMDIGDTPQTNSHPKQPRDTDSIDTHQIKDRAVTPVKVDPSLRSYSHNIAFSASDADTVAWASGTITLADGTSFSIDAGNTGNMTARTYIYFDYKESFNALQTSTTFSDAVGEGKILLASAQNGTGEATFFVMGGIGGINIDANSIVVANLAAINADLGTITAGNITLDSSGFLRSNGKDNYSDTTAGFFIGYDTDNYKVNIGDATQYIKWSGSSFSIAGDFNTDKAFTAGESISQFDAVGLYGEITTAAYETTESAHIDENNPDTSYQTIVAGQGAGGDERRGFVSFTNLADSVPVGATIVNCTIYFYCSSGATSHQFEGYDLTSGFDKSTVTWNSPPTYNAGGLFNFSTPGSLPGWTAGDNFEVTSTEWDNICDYGIMIGELSVQVADTTFDDEDDTYPAYLTVTYKMQDGDIYKVKATTAEYAGSFMGIALNAAAADGTVVVRMDGVVTGMAGLTAYSDYLLTDTDGTIGTSQGTVKKTIGRALSTTELQVKYALGTGA